MKKTWKAFLKKILIALLIAAMLVQAVPAMAAEGLQQHCILQDEDLYEVVPWMDWTMEGGIYYLVNKKSGLVLDVQGDADYSTELSSMQLYEKTGGNNPSQQFRISYGAGGWNILPLSNTNLVVNPYSNTPKNGTRINLYSRDTNDITQSWKFEWIEEEKGWIIKSAYNEKLTVTALGTNKKSKIALRNYRENDLTQIWEIEPYLDSALVLNNGTCRVNMPASWEGRYFTRETDFCNGLCTEFYSSVCYEQYAGSGRLFDIVTCDEIDYNWPDFRILGSANGQYVVMMIPTDVQFDPGNVTSTNEYLSLSADIEKMIWNFQCGNFDHKGRVTIRPYVYYGHSDEYEGYMGVDEYGRLIETKYGYYYNCTDNLDDPVDPDTDDSEMPYCEDSWFVDPASEIGRAENLLLPGVWHLSQDLWTEESKASYSDFRISFGTDGSIEILDGSGYIITGTYQLNVYGKDDSLVVAKVDTDEGKYHLIISIYRMCMEIYGLPEVTVEYADGSLHQTRVWGFYYFLPGMISDYIA